MSRELLPPPGDVKSLYELPIKKYIIVAEKDWLEGLVEVNSKSDGSWKFIYG